MRLPNPIDSNARLRFAPRGEAGREALEAFIHATYARAYGADVRHFLPLLIGLETAGGSPLAAMGLRPAAQERLYLEHYLDQPVEQVLAERFGVPVGRGEVVELGNLAVGTPGAARLMIVALNAYLSGAGYRWVVFTAVPALRNAFARLGLRLEELAPADGDRLGIERARWGSYYAQRPVVVAGDVAWGFAALDDAMRLETAMGMLRGLRDCALAEGRGMAA